MGRDAGANGCGAQIDFANQFRGLAQPFLVFAQHHRIGQEFLSQGHGDGILQLCPPHFQNTREGICSFAEGQTQNRHGIDQGANTEKPRYL